MLANARQQEAFIVSWYSAFRGSASIDLAELAQLWDATAGNAEREALATEYGFEDAAECASLIARYRLALLDLEEG
jgi:hypothetical protein